MMQGWVFSDLDAFNKGKWGKKPARSLAMQILQLQPPSIKRFVVQPKCLILLVLFWVVFAVGKAS
jgi:hypothetical protein